jgi:hypothetical protein
MTQLSTISRIDINDLLNEHMITNRTAFKNYLKEIWKVII